MNLTELIERQREHHQARNLMLSEILDFMQGDFYRGGKGFDGPPPLKLEDKQESSLTNIHSTVMKLVPTYFTNKDMVRKACSRHRDGVLGKEPNWWWIKPELVKSTEQDRDEKTTRLDKIYTDWWDEAKVLPSIGENTYNALWAYDDSLQLGKDYSSKVMSNDGRTVRTPSLTSAILRFYLPRRFIVKGTDGLATVKGKNFEEILKSTRVQALSPIVSGMVKDDDGEPLFGYFDYALNRWESNRENRTNEIEVSILYRDAPDELKKAVGGTLPKNPDDLTIHARMDDKENIIQASVVDLGGRLHFYEMKREPLVTAASLNLQRKINLISTILSINAGDGVGMTILANAVPPGKAYIKDALGVETVTTVVQGMMHDKREDVRFEFSSMPIGGGSVLLPQGSPTFDGEGNYLGPTNPSFQKTSPFDTSALRDDREAFKIDFYEEVDQQYIISTADGNMSAESRKQQMAVFENSLRPTSTAVAGAIRWVMETSRAFASYYSNDKSFDELVAYAQPNLSVTVLTSEDKKVVLDAVDKKILSAERGRTEMGVEDPQKEVAVINNEAADPFNVQKEEAAQAEMEKIAAKKPEPQKESI